ncbi:hypothetical protein H072_3120 [Dactylellina haptotyla CBS 200.50]|uniref:Uncharacterized protein n=1 Tax=Dactylellina haptotyla (strain CBS 200.50) TaxID=1284197 RepID=S8C500_DACHA|nr:hypothetical protein H072_3120 [Dactylellina haptotyla CBS 200.50]
MRTRAISIINSSFAHGTREKAFNRRFTGNPSPGFLGDVTNARFIFDLCADQVRTALDLMDGAKLTEAIRYIGARELDRLVMRVISERYLELETLAVFSSTGTQRIHSEWPFGTELLAVYLTKAFSKLEYIFDGSNDKPIERLLDPEATMVQVGFAGRQLTYPEMEDRGCVRLFSYGPSEGYADGFDENIVFVYYPLDQ